MHLRPPDPIPAPGPSGAPRSGWEASREPLASLGTGAALWLVRHGSVIHTTAAYGDTDVQLSAVGLEETAGVAAGFRGLELDDLVASPLSRARALGEAIAASTDTALRIDDRWRELHRGDWQGLPREEYHRRWCDDRAAYWTDPLRWRGHGGESELDMVGRAWPALLEAAELVGARASAGTGVVAAHRQVIRSVVAAALGLPAGRSHGLRLDPAHGVLLIDHPGGWSLARTNIGRPGAPHLAEPLEGPYAGPPEDVATRR